METLSSIPSRFLFLSCHESITKHIHGNYAFSTSLKPSFKGSKLILGSRRSIGEISTRVTTDQTEIATDGHKPSTSVIEVKENERWNELVEEIKEMFRSLSDGGISPSAYDTAWVARIPSLDDPNKPHFQESLDWILMNQLKDGSWGDPGYFLIFDRLISTLSCVIALKTWNTADERITKGIEFLRENIKMLEETVDIQMPCGFELSFPYMLKEAKTLGIDLPYGHPCLSKFYALREKKLKRIPVEVIHEVHTTVLFTLEALQEVVQWEKIQKLQLKDGSFQSSPAATAAAYMNTGNKKCLEFLENIVKAFNGSAPTLYPIENFERLWTLDTICRLGIDHLFREEISDKVDYMYRRLQKGGLSWSKYNPNCDVDDTAMALRHLRIHGYPVSADVLEYFRDNDGTVVTYHGENHRGVSDMFTLYRFSLAGFPGEKEIKEVKAFTKEWLQNRLDTNQVEDKWAIKKALDKEIDHALRNPWIKSLPRFDARVYIDQYGDDDVWIGKGLYRLYNVNNSKYLELAKLEFNRLQKMYQEENLVVLKWWNGLEFNEHFAAKERPEEIHFLIAATFYDPEFSAARIDYTKCNCLENILKDLFENHESIDDLRILCQATQEWIPSLVDTLPLAIKIAFQGMYQEFNELVKQASRKQKKDMFSYLHSLRFKQLQAYLKNREMRKEGMHFKSSQEYFEYNKRDAAVAVRVIPSMFLIGEKLQDYELSCLDDRSRFHEKLSWFLTLINFDNHEKFGNEEVARAFNCFIKENNWNERESKTQLATKIEDTFDELVYEYLKPGRVPRNSRRLMYEHGKIMEYLQSAKINHAKRSQMINTMQYLSTPI